MASAVRPLERADIPAVIELHRESFGAVSSLSDSELEAQLVDAFIIHPWRDAGTPGALLVERAGLIRAFVGLAPLRFLYEGRPRRGVIPSQFMAAADAGPDAAYLLREVFSLDTDLVVTDGATDRVRRLWCALGGEVLWLQSLYWRIVLRPLEDLAVRGAARHGVLGAAAAASLPLWRALDRQAGRFRRAMIWEDDGRLVASPFSAGLLTTERDLFCGGRRLVPHYDTSAVEWLLARMNQKRRHGKLESKCLSDHDGRTAGWYLYHVRSNDSAEVIQVVSAPNWIGQVLHHLLRDARDRGAVAVTGSADRDVLAVVGDLSGLRRRTGAWSLAFSRDRRILLALQAGDARFTRLDAEYWMRFLGE